jgi:hypothetical protein
METKCTNYLVKFYSVVMLGMWFQMIYDLGLHSKHMYVCGFGKNLHMNMSMSLNLPSSPALSLLVLF